jgi:hypothetical protein
MLRLLIFSQILWNNFVLLLFPLVQCFRKGHNPPNQVCNHIMDNCEFKNCEISFNKSDTANSDLVLFNHGEMNIQPPVKRNNQIWVFSSNESPPHTSNYYTQKQFLDVLLPLRYCMTVAHNPCYVF